MQRPRGILAVVSGPSGVGKGCICRQLLAIRPQTAYAVSATTRAPRAGEVDGVNYYFLPQADFLRKIEAGEFLEWAQVYGNYYGTLKADVERLLHDGKDVILEIDTQGAMQIKAVWPTALLIFIMPPSFAELQRRIVGRGSETAASLALRLSEAAVEMELAETEYDHCIVNHTVEQAAAELQAVLDAVPRCQVITD